MCEKYIFETGVARVKKTPPLLLLQNLWKFELDILRKIEGTALEDISLPPITDTFKGAFDQARFNT